MEIRRIPPDPTFRPGADVPPALQDAVSIRMQVFVDEQGCSAENEIDEDDAHSWHWVVYSDPGIDSRGNVHHTPLDGGFSNGTITNSGKKIAIGTVRLVPPHEHHQDQDQVHQHMTKEPYVKITRVAVLPTYRGRGIARHLVETAVEWAASSGDVDIDAASDSVSGNAVPASQRPQQTDQRMIPGGRNGASGDSNCTQTQEGREGWKGLILVHAQVDVEGMYARLGFWRDEGMGRWLEEGIEHVGMWRRLELESRT